MTEQQADADRRFGPRATAVIREWTGAYPAEDRDQPMTNHDRMNYWWRRATQADAELDSWMTRAYEAEGKLWKAEARIRHLEDTAQVLVKEVLDAENARDESRRGKAEAEARIKDVQDVHRKWTVGDPCDKRRGCGGADCAPHVNGHGDKVWRHWRDDCTGCAATWPCPTIRALDG